MEDTKVIKNDDIKPVESTKCLNCGTEFIGNFCPECGQRADTSRFTIKFIFANLLKAILSNDGGVWITLKTLLTHPGRMMVDIINGKRKSYFSPFPMLFLALSLYVMIFTFTGSKNMDFDPLYIDEPKVEETDAMSGDMNMYLNEAQKASNKLKRLINKCMVFYSKNYATCYILTIPIYILAARVSFGRKNRRRYNWGEYCIPIVYSLVLIVLYRCLMSIVFYFSNDVANTMEQLTAMLNIVVYTACFKKMLDFTMAKMIWRSLLTIVFYWGFLFIFAIIAIVLYVMLF